MDIDHITIAGPDLAVLQDSFAAAGLATEYGGRHSNGITHMSWLGFDDYSYLELVSTLEPKHGVPLWKGHSANPAGGTAWTIHVDDIEAEAERIRSRNVAVHGPVRIERQKPDGVVGKWDLALPGDAAAPGGVLPFLISDETPRSVRVRPSPAVAYPTRTSPGELGGLMIVMIAVTNVEHHIAPFRDLWGWDAPRILDDRDTGVRLAIFANEPVVLIAPTQAATFVRTHLDDYGESPCGCLISATEFVKTARYFRSEPGELGNLRVAWINLPGVTMLRVGLVDPE
ncbi:MAG: VOC family protein [Bryobacteraceae bacterium]|nr:VOC family protein [Bryobacteraceae bacterium]